MPRIPDTTLDDNYLDGQDWDAATLNKIIAVLISGINANYEDIINKAMIPGPQGPQGIQGIQGDIGPIGPIGPQGEQGEQGVQGMQGIQGIQGEVGPIGPKGDTGDVGPQGPKGDTGDTGPAGPSVWGGISGTLSSQADLQSDLNSKLASSSYTAADVLAKLLTVDGTGSGLDADLLDGIQASSFINQFKINRGTGTVRFVKIAELQLSIGSDYNNLVLLISGGGDYGNNKTSQDMLQVSTRGGVSLRVVTLMTAGLTPTRYFYVSNATSGKLEVWIRLTQYNYEINIASLSNNWGNIAANTVGWGTELATFPSGSVEVTPFILGNMTNSVKVNLTANYTVADYNDNQLTMNQLLIAGSLLSVSSNTIVVGTNVTRLKISGMITLNVTGPVSPEDTTLKNLRIKRSGTTILNVGRKTLASESVIIPTVYIDVVAGDTITWSYQGLPSDVVSSTGSTTFLYVESVN